MLCVCVLPAQQEVLRLRYDDYAQCVSDDHLIRVKAFVEAPGENEPLLTVTDIPLSRPDVFIQVGTPVEVTWVIIALYFLTRFNFLFVSQSWFVCPSSGFFVWKSFTLVFTSFSVGLSLFSYYCVEGTRQRKTLENQYSSKNSLWMQLIRSLVDIQFQTF